MTHLTFEQISDLAERGNSNAAGASHVAECAECRDTLRRVQALLQTAKTLPRDMEPPPAAWDTVRDRLRREHARPPARGRWLRTALIAASVIFLAASMSVVTLSLRGRPAKAKAASMARVAPPPSVPALLAVDRNYDPTIRELRESLTSQRSQLSPSTVRVVDRALVVIDSAIAEARAALAADPANQALVDILSSHYERKVDLLQRATELSSS